MSNIYVKRGAIVTAEAFDPARSDQGVDINLSQPGPEDPDDGSFVPQFVSASVISRNRLVSVHAGDMLCAAEAGVLVLSPVQFTAVYQPLEEVVQNDAIVQTGGNQ